MKSSSLMPSHDPQTQGLETEAKLSKRLLSRQNDLAALQRRLDGLTAEITAITGQLLAERATELQRLDDDAQDAIKPKRLELAELDGQLNVARQALIEPELALTALKAEYGHVEVRLASAKAELTDVLQQKDELELANSGLKAQNQHLADQIEPLKTEISDLMTEKTDLATEIVRLTGTAAAMRLQNDKDNAEAADKIHILLEQRDELTIYLEQRQREFDLAAKAMGERQLAQDARDENLRMREARVSQDQRKISQNARLLEL